MIESIKPEEIILYLRKSRTDDPALSVSETVAKHEQMLDAYCMRVFGELVPEQNRFREIVSGETISARPEIQKVLRLIEQPRYKAILIVEPQRLSRGDLEDIGRLSKIFRYTKTLVITLQYSYDLTDDRDRDYFERELKRGNEYLEYSKRIMMNGRNLAAEKGYYTGSRKPYGYKRVFRKEGNKRFPTLEIIPQEAEVVRMIFNMYAGGIGATGICSKLNALGIKPERDDMWSPPTIYAMLDNPLYNGKIKWGARKSVKTVVDGEITVHNPRNPDCPIYEGRHEAIISDALFAAVHARRGGSGIPRVSVSRELQNPLSGIVWCVCGRMMIRRPYSGRSADRLQCPNQPYCGNASCTMDEALSAVANILHEAIEDFSVQTSKPDQMNLRVLSDRLAEIDRKETALWEKYSEGMPKRVFDELLEKVVRQREEVQSMIQDAPQIDFEERTVAFHEALDALHSDLPASAKNSLLKACIKRIIYSRERGERKGKYWNNEPMRLTVELAL